MDNFAEAQRLFGIYQNQGGFNNLRSSLDMLDAIIESKGEDYQRAANFKNTISNHITKQIKEIFVQCNIPDFAKDIKTIDNPDLMIEKLSPILSAAFAKKDGEKFMELLKILSEHFEVKIK